MIEVINRQRKHRLPLMRFKAALERLTRFYGVKNAGLTLVFCGRKAIRTLNRKYRKEDRPTDVLSFPIRETAADGEFYLGDIVVSVPAAYSQGRAAGHGLVKEIEILITHSFLHLLGYDHSKAMDREEEKAARMLES